MRARSLLSGAGGTILIAGTILAAPTLPVSYYNMNNGDGTNHLGPSTIDVTYNGSGLTTPIIHPQRWQGFSPSAFMPSTGADYYGTAGTGQYVGWKTTVFGDPTILFHLFGNTDVHSISFYVENSYVGLVGGPGSITINGTTYNSSYLGWTTTALIPHVGDAGGAEKITISGLNIKLHDIDVALHAGPAGADVAAYNLAYPGDQQTSGKEPWIMLSEVQFNGVTNAVPESSTWIMMLIGFAAIGYAARRRQKMAVAA
jgi:hypothetical protein